MLQQCLSPSSKPWSAMLTVTWSKSEGTEAVVAIIMVGEEAEAITMVGGIAADWDNPIPSRWRRVVNLKIDGVIMIRNFVGAAAIAATVFLPVASQAQGVPGGMERGARDGERAAGPVGAVVGGVIGGVVGGVTGVLGIDERPRFRSYVVEQRHPSYQYREDVRIGAVLPDEGVTYYDVPPEYGVRGHRYTVVNGRAVLVDPRTHRIVEIVE
jgi:hypothetical protein